MTQTLPTSDLYFLNSCRSFVGRWWRSGPIKRLGANSFRCGERHLLIRRDEPALMEAALVGDHSLIYLIDDDIAGADLSLSLPASYRARLADFARRYHSRFLARAAMIVTSSDVLAAKFRSDSGIAADVVRINPFWAMPLADQIHFSASDNAKIEIVHLGTASHGGGLSHVTPAVIALLDRFPTARFTFVGKAGHHPGLEGHPQTRRVNVMTWHRYRRWLPRQRFHVALYPLEQTPFDQARSANKIFEHAIVGAVGVYPKHWKPAAMVGNGAVLAPDDLDDWGQTLVDAIERKFALAEMARTAARSLESRDDGSAQRQTWGKLLNIDTSTRDSR